MPVSKISSVGFSSSNVRRIAVDRPALLGLDLLLLAVDHVSEHVEETPERPSARPAPRSERPVSTASAPRGMPSVESIATARTVSSPRCCCTSAMRSIAGTPVRALDRDAERVVDLRQLVGEDDVDDDALDLDDLPGVRRRDGLGHEAPGLLLQSRRSVYRLRPSPWPRRRTRTSSAGLAASRPARRAVRPAVEPAEPVSLARLRRQQGDLGPWSAAVRRVSPRLR